MTAISTNLERPGAGIAADPAELVAIAFLARYSGRTLDAYRHSTRLVRLGGELGRQAAAIAGRRLRLVQEHVGTEALAGADLRTCLS